MRRLHNKIPKLHIKRGDMVKVLSGSQRGQTGRVLEVYPLERKAIVEGINIITKHIKPTQGQAPGERIEREASVHVSKLQLIDPKTNKPTRIGRKFDSKKGWVRVSKKSGQLIAESKF